jgi:hypothetical protein
MAVMGSFFDVIKCDKIYLLKSTDLQKDRKYNNDDVNHVTLVLRDYRDTTILRYDTKCRC